MPRHRLPKELAKITGADIAQPGRFAARTEPKSAPIGDAPDKLTSDERAAWIGLVDDMPWLTASDRTITEMAARLVARINVDPACPIGVYTQLRLCLSAIGGTPVDRSKVGAGDNEDDEANKFFQ